MADPGLAEELGAFLIDGAGGGPMHSPATSLPLHLSRYITTVSSRPVSIFNELDMLSRGPAAVEAAVLPRSGGSTDSGE